MVEESGERTGVLQEYWHNYMEYGDSPKTRKVGKKSDERSRKLLRNTNKIHMRLEIKTPISTRKSEYPLFII